MPARRLTILPLIAWAALLLTACAARAPGRPAAPPAGIAGDPAVVGCADGQREAFTDARAYPRIAGCLAGWEGKRDLRAGPTGRPCGDDAGACAAPADACAPGWRLCGGTGALADLRSLTGTQCEQAGPGRFVAAISHCESQWGCEYDRAATARYQCYADGWCAEPVCCGAACRDTGTCADGVWLKGTHIVDGKRGCGALALAPDEGVLCCRAPD
jgi:hypothetical protein